MAFFEILDLFFQTLYRALHTNDFIFKNFTLFLKSKKQIKLSINNFCRYTAFVREFSFGIISFFGYKISN